MSEYQYYEFQAIDRPLTEEEQREVRSVSTRAVITATRFTNHYEWGNFKGNPTVCFGPSDSPMANPMKQAPA